MGVGSSSETAEASEARLCLPPLRNGALATTLKDRPERVKEVNGEVEGLGATIVAQYATLGQYDFVTVLEAPDAETMTRISVRLGGRRTASYETLQAMSVDDFISSVKG